MKKLTPKQERKLKEARICASHRHFVSEYLKDLNGSAAWIRSGHSCSENVARASAARVLANVNVKALVRQHLEDQAVAANLSVGMILREFMRLGLADIRAVVTLKDGKMTVKDTSEWSDDAAAAVSEVSQITVERGRDGYTNTTTVLKVKMHSKTQALDSLAKHLNLFRDTVVNNSLQVNVSISDLAKLIHEPKPPSRSDESQLASGEMIDG